jgi:membrane associated rhomboid family serine protease
MIGAIPLLLIIVNVLVSYRALKDNALFERYVFEVDKVLIFKQYYRILSSGFLHVSWFHLIFNMLSLYAFSGMLISWIGEGKFLLIYFLSLVGGGLFSLFIHRNEGSYRAVGASGAVNGVMFASIALFPNLGIGFFFLPISIPSWVFGFIYIIYCIYGIKSKGRGVGHDAHFGGAIIGLLIAVLMYPQALRQNYIPILLILVPSIIFIYLLIKQPHMLLLNSNYGGISKYSIDQKYNKAKQDRQLELDRLLDKIATSGMESLSKKEKEELKRLSREAK